MKMNSTKLVILFCLLAGVRIFVFSAAFPFFINVDENAHYDMICKYAAGHIPTRLEHYSEETACMTPLCGSREYYTDWFEYGSYEANTPPWTIPNATTALEGYQEAKQAILDMTNHESTQAPLYYLVAGGWHDLGKALGIRGGMLLYWLRFLNIPIFMLLVWIAYLITRKLSPGNTWLNLGVPAMLVIFPQDVFYGLNSDVLTALLATLSLYLMIVYLLENRGMGFCILAGLSVAAAFLTKMTNLPLPVMFGGILAAKMVRSRQKGEFRRHIPGLIAIVLAAAIPIGAWLIRNQLVLGDFSGCHTKIVRLSWTVKSFGQMFHHPIFTPGGAAYFLGELTRTLWRGEIVWHKVRIASVTADIIYVATSWAFLPAAAALIWRRKEERFAGVVNFLVLGVSVAFLAGLSLIYDFHDCRYPSRELPYFTSGRLILGALVPFLMLYLVGLGAILDWLKIGRLRWTVLSLILLLALGSEVLITRHVFASAYNFYHMLGR